MTRLVVTGSRHWTDRAVVEEALRRLPVGRLAHGGARGLDTIADEIARALWDEPVARTLSVAERIRALVGQHAAERREPHGNEVALALEVQTLRAERDRLRALLAAYGRAVEERREDMAADALLDIEDEAAKWREWG